MADEADMSQARMEKESELYQQQRQRLAAKKSVTEYCEECGDFIPQARQQVTGGTSLCITCAEAFEMKRKHYR